VKTGFMRPRILICAFGLALVTSICLAGCSEPKFYPTRGKITIYGVGPLSEGEIRFRPVSKPGLVASGSIQKDGTFSVSTPGHGDGVLEGDCDVAIIVEPKNGKRVIAERYGDYATADKHFTITPRDENYFILEVKPR
jgi:hypothetical protein